MFLLAAVVVGLSAALIRALWTRRGLRPYDLKLIWLVFLAFVPQWLAFILPVTKDRLPDAWVPWILVPSQIGLLVFALANLKKPGFWLLALGLALNLTVIAANGGMMPISPENVRKVYPDAPAGAWQIGERLGTSKDIVLPVEHTALWFLTDLFHLTYGAGKNVVFSLGDGLVWCGIVWALWSLGGPAIKERASAGQRVPAAAADLRSPGD